MGMNPNFQGGCSTALLLINSLTLQVGQMSLKSSVTFPVHVKLEYWPHVKANSFEEPDEPEFLEVYSVTLLSPLYMTNFTGLTMSLDSRLNLLDILSNYQYERLVAALLQPSTCGAFDGTSVTL
jgi:hypothetical protein